VLATMRCWYPLITQFWRNPTGKHRKRGRGGHLLHFVTDVQLVGVEQQQDEVASGGKPPAHLQKGPTVTKHAWL